MSTELLERQQELIAGLDARAGDLAAGSPEWLRALRERGHATHRALGVPTTRHEEWKYTSLRSLTEARLVPAPEANPTLGEIEEFLRAADDEIRIVFVNGRYAPDLTTPLREVEGLTVRELPCAIRDGLPVVENHLGRIAPIDEYTFSALNTAMFEGGAVIHVAANTKVERPIHVLYLTNTRGLPAGEVAATFPRTLVVMETGAEAFLLETYGTLGEGAGFSCAVTEIAVATNANLEHVKAQRESETSFHIALTQARQERDSSVNSFSVTYGGALTRNDLNIFLNGSNLHCRMDGVVVIAGHQHADNHTRLDHAFPHCDSFEVYKHVLNDHSTAVFNGKIYVHQDAQKTDAKQTNQTLLLSRDATINSKPQLEIFADDVKCTHGATVGQIREDMLFYLRARGVPGDQARAMLVYAFAAEVLEKISHEGTRKELERLLFEKLTPSGQP